MTQHQLAAIVGAAQGTISSYLNNRNEIRSEAKEKLRGLKGYPAAYGRVPDAIIPVWDDEAARSALQQFLDKNRMTQGNLATKAGISQPQISALMNGRKLATPSQNALFCVDGLLEIYTPELHKRQKANAIAFADNLVQHINAQPVPPGNSIADVLNTPIKNLFKSTTQHEGTVNAGEKDIER